MMHLTKWFGLSFTLHLAAASILILMASPEAHHPPKAMVVMLDLLELPEPAQPKPVRAALRPALPSATSASAHQAVPVLSKAVPALVEPAAHPIQPAAPSHASGRPAEPSPAPETARTAQSHATAAPSLPSPALSVVRTAQATAEPRPTQEAAQQRYVKENFAYIRELVTRHLVYPPQARRMNWSGRTLLSFTVAEDGSVHAIRVIESSGYQVLDRSALETIRTAAPFPKPPVRAEIVLPVHFKLQR